MTANSHKLDGSDRATAAAIRAQLKLRWNTLCGCYEVFTTIHGTGIFRWIKIDAITMQWYQRTFQLAMPVVGYFNDVDGSLFNYKDTETETVLQQPQYPG